MLKRQLTLAKYVVDVANNGQECLDTLIATANDPEKAPDVVLMDIEMPVKNGLEALRELRQLERDGKMPRRHRVIAVTGNARSGQVGTSIPLLYFWVRLTRLSQTSFWPLALTRSRSSLTRSRSCSSRSRASQACRPRAPIRTRWSCPDIILPTHSRQACSSGCTLSHRSGCCTCTLDCCSRSASEPPNVYIVRFEREAEAGDELPWHLCFYFCNKTR